MSIPSDLQEIAAASRVYGNDWNEFDCQTSVATVPVVKESMYHPLNWKMTVRQFDRGAGILQNAFMEANASENEVFLNKLYLLMNFTGDLMSRSSVIPDWTADPVVNPSYLGRIFNDSIPGLVRMSRSDWVDLYQRQEGDKAEL
jgi:hypothetical protein